MTMATKEKGRLEKTLDNFTEIHGTVLLGMHKELQTLKRDVELNTEKHIEVALREIKELSIQLSQRIEQFHDFSDSIALQQKNSITSIEAASKKAIEEIYNVKTSGLIDLNNRLSEIEQYRSAFQNEAVVAQQSISQTLSDFQSRLSAALSYTNKVNAESQAMLRKANEKHKLLHLREVQLNKRTRALTLGVGLSALVTIALSIWPVLNH